MTIPDPFEDIVQPVQDFHAVPFASHNDYEVEIELIGSILRKGEIFDDVSSELRIDMLHNTVCQDIYKAMGKVREHNLIMDVVTVGDQLSRDGLLSTIQYDVFHDRAALGKIRERGNPKGVKSYLELVIDYWAKRGIDELSASLVTQARNGRRAVDILADARIKMDEFNVGGNTENATYTAGQSASIAYDHAFSASKGEVKGVGTGFIDLDKMIMQLPGNLSLIAGRPGQGKSALLDSIAANLSGGQGKKLGIFSLEMSAKEFATRMMSAICEVPSDRILRGKMTDLEWPKYTHSVEVFEKYPLMINDKQGLTLSQMHKEVKRMSKSLGGLDLLMVDYIQLMKSTKGVKNRYQEIGEITRGLKEIGGEFDVPVLAAGQMNRASDGRSDRRPVLSDLRESGDLENDAHAVMFIWYPDLVKPAEAEIIVAKNRNGPAGVCNLVFRGAFARFESATTRNYQPEPIRDYTDQ